MTVDIEDRLCMIDVVDRGRGPGEEALQASMPQPSAEQGRGLYLIRMLTENVRLRRHPGQGTIVHFEKRLEW